MYKQNEMHSTSCATAKKTWTAIPMNYQALAVLDIAIWTVCSNGQMDLATDLKIGLLEDN